MYTCASRNMEAWSSVYRHCQVCLLVCYCGILDRLIVNITRFDIGAIVERLNIISDKFSLDLSKNASLIS